MEGSKLKQQGRRALLDICKIVLLIAPELNNIKINEIREHFETIWVGF